MKSKNKESFSSFSKTVCQSLSHLVFVKLNFFKATKSKSLHWSKELYTLRLGLHCKQPEYWSFPSMFKISPQIWKACWSRWVPKKEALSWRFAGRKHMRTYLQDPLRWGGREVGVSKGRNGMQCRPNRVLSWFLLSRHGPSELSRPKGTDNNQSLNWLQLCNGRSLKLDWLGDSSFWQAPEKNSAESCQPRKLPASGRRSGPVMVGGNLGRLQACLWFP